MAHPDYERHATVFETAEAEAEYEFYSNSSMAEIFEVEPDALEAYDDFLVHLATVPGKAGRRPYLLESLEKETAEEHFRYEESADYDYLRESGLVETYSEHHLMMNNGI